MRVALVHDWLTGTRGGEKVLLELVRMFPGAPIFTLFHFPGSPVAPRSRRPTSGRRSSRSSSRPASTTGSSSRSSSSPPRPGTSSGFDLVISSSHCVAKNAKKAAGRVPPLLLPHARPVPQRPVRRLLPRAVGPRDGRGAPRARPPPRLGSGRRAPRRRIPRELREREGPHRPPLADARRPSSSRPSTPLSTRRRRPAPPETGCSSSRRWPPTSASRTPSTPRTPGGCR